jgi:hypothetical protein
MSACFFLTGKTATAAIYSVYAIEKHEVYPEIV